MLITALKLEYAPDDQKFPRRTRRSELPKSYQLFLLKQEVITFNFISTSSYE